MQASERAKQLLSALYGQAPDKHTLADAMTDIDNVRRLGAVMRDACETVPTDWDLAAARVMQAMGYGGRR